MKTQSDVNSRKRQLAQRLLSKIFALHHEAVQDGWKNELVINAYDLELPVPSKINFSLVIGNPMHKPYLCNVSLIIVKCEDIFLGANPKNLTSQYLAAQIAFYSKHTKKIEEIMRSVWEEQKAISSDDHEALELMEQAEKELCHESI